MKYVVDSSVGFKWVLIENLSDKLLAPDVFPVEIAHALTRADRQKRSRSCLYRFPALSARVHGQRG